jgi:hypothetical protein
MTSNATTNNNRKISNESPPYYTGNVQLMEARCLELTSSIRALYKSIQELQSFIEEEQQQQQQKAEGQNADPEFVQAIEENVILIDKQRAELVSLIQGMQQFGANIQVPEDIQVMDVQQMRGSREAMSTNDAVDESVEDNNGVYL